MPSLTSVLWNDYEYVLDKIHQSFAKTHVAFVFEDVCRELLMTRKDLPCHFSRIGRYWDNHTKIDLVAVNEEEHTILFGECKYRTSPVDMEVLYDLEKKSASVSWYASNRKEYYVLCSISGFTQELQKAAGKRYDLLLFSDF